jgi:PAS domain-containing protein
LPIDTAPAPCGNDKLSRIRVFYGIVLSEFVMRPVRAADNAMDESRIEMGQDYTRATYLLLLAAIACVPLVAVGFRRRNVPGATALGIMGVGVFLWTMTNALQLLGVPIGGWLASCVAFAGIGLIPPAWLSFSFESTGRRTPRGYLAFGAAVCLLTIAMVATNSSHHLVWRTVSTEAGPVSHRWWYFWLFVSCSYGLVALGVLRLLVSTHRLPRLYRLQGIVMAVAGLIPLTVSFLHLARILPPTPFDPTQLGFLASVALAGWATFRLRVLDLTPVPAEVLIEKISDGVLVVDCQERVLSINAVAAQLLGSDAREAIGGRAASAFPGWPRIRGLCATKENARGELALGDGTSRLQVEVEATALMAPNNAVAGHLLLLRNVTEARHRESEREQLVTELQAALAQVKQLSGLLPICASCKRIRDKGGQWQPLELYLRDHSDAKFSHGLCPHCIPAFENR